MSYILDALRRADAERERERGSVPGLHAQPMLAAAMEPDPPSRRWWIAGTGAAGLVLALLAGWGVWAWQGESPRVLVAAAPAPALAAAALPSGAPLAAPGVVETPANALATPVGPTVPTPVPRVMASAPAAGGPASPPASRDAAVAAEAPASPAVRVPVPRTPPRRTALEAGHAPAPAPASAPSRPASAEARVPTLAELPEALRRELPTLTFGGAMHSPDAGSRMLIVNGQVFHEGEKVAPELWLEQIKLKDAVLRYKGQRYSVSF